MPAQAMTRLNVEGPQADAHARRTAAAEAREADLRAQGENAAADARRDKRTISTASAKRVRARAKNEKDSLPGLVQTVNELQEQVAELQKIVGADVRMMDAQTVDLVLVFTDPQKAANERDKKIVKNYQLHTADVVRKANNRIYKKTATAKKTATSKKVKALEVLKAELEVEVEELKARKAVMPGSAVFHS